MRSKATRIPELSALDDIEEIEHCYFRDYGTRPVNLSHWNPSTEVSRMMEGALVLPDLPTGIDYHFSYDLPEREELLSHVGLESAGKSTVITPSGSTSILMVARYLGAIGIQDVSFLGPGYFTVPANLQAEGINVHIDHLHRTKQGFKLPVLNLGKRSALWITNPVYCAGTQYELADVDWFHDYLRGGGTLICDECLAWGGIELGRALGKWPGFIGIYSPHKALCTNGMKYSFVAFDHKSQKFFDDWADALYGCLPASAVVAVRHSLGVHFGQYQERFGTIIGQAKAFVIETMRRYGIGFDEGSSGYLMTAYAPHIRQPSCVDIGFMRDLVYATASSFIPGIRNHFDPALGLCFRINLARDGADFRGALVRVLQYLHAHR